MCLETSRSAELTRYRRPLACTRGVRGKEALLPQREGGGERESKHQIFLQNKEKILEFYGAYWLFGDAHSESHSFRDI